MKWLGLLLMAVGLVGGILLYDTYVPIYVTANGPVPGSDVIVHSETFYLSAALPMCCVFIGGMILFLAGRRVARKSTQS